MWQFERSFMVEWGDCDEAGIVFYPRFFYWFDSTYQAWLRSVGLSQRVLRQRYDAVTPLIDVGANFIAPATYDDEIIVRVQVESWTERRFKLLYQIYLAERLIITGHEWRAWAQMLPEGGLRGVPIPQDFRALLSS